MQSPFKFLDSFTKEDKDIFFGREHETEELYQKIFESKILLVYGVSGTGKSSLINCGLVSKFSESDWLPVNIRRGSNINESLSKAINSKQLSEPQTTNNKQLKRSLRSLYLDHFKPIYLIFDQFEELFIFGNHSEKEDFIKQVKEITESDLNVKFLFVIREEYLASITEFEKQIPTFLANRVRIEKMSRLNAQQAIEGPCKFAGIEVEENFSNLLLDRLSPEGSEVELTYLQVFLDKIFKHASSEQNLELIKFSLSHLEKIGDVKDLLGSFLEEQIAQLEEPDTALVVLKAFVSTKGTKRQVSEYEVLDYSRTLGKNINKETLRELILKFVALRILRDKDESGRYELRHDALAAKIFEKITVFEKDLLEIRQFIENAQANYEKRNILLSVSDLKYIGQYEDKLFLGGALLEFVNVSKEDIRKKRKILNRITLLSIFVLLLVFALTVKYITNQIEVSDSKDIAIASIFESTDPVNSFLLADKAHSIQPTDVTLTALFKSFYGILEKGNNNQLKTIFDFKPCNSEILFADFSTDSAFIYGYTADSEIYLWKINGSVVTKIKAYEIPILLKLSADSKYFVAIFPSKKSTVWNAYGDSLFSFLATYDKHNIMDIVSFSANKSLLATCDSNNVLIFNLPDGKLFQKISQHSGNVNSVNFSPDERFLVTASKDNTAIIWYYNSLSSNYKEYSKITNHKGIVWSALFNPQSNYIITASADSTFNIYKVTGELHLSFIDNTSPTPNNRAAFTKSFIYISYSSYKDVNRINVDSIFFWSSAINNIDFMNPRFDNDTSIDAIDVSPLDYFQAFTSRQRAGVTLTTSFDYRFINVITFQGNQPRFSNNGDYLLTITGNELKLFPANETILRKLFFETKIFGDIRKEGYQLE